MGRGAQAVKVTLAILLPVLLVNASLLLAGLWSILGGVGAAIGHTGDRLGTAGACMISVVGLVLAGLASRRLRAWAFAPTEGRSREGVMTPLGARVITILLTLSICCNTLRRVRDSIVASCCG